MAKTTSIHINGKHYDALTGALIGETRTGGARKAPVKSIDGVVGGPRKHTAKQATRPRTAHPAATSAPVVVAAPAPAHSPRPRPTRDTPRTRAVHATVRKNRPSTTLMRHTVKKPAPSTKAVIKVQSHLHASARPHHMAVITDFGPIKPKVGFHAVHAKRVERSAKAPTSSKVAHFAHELRTELPAATEHAVKAIDAAIIIPKTVGPVAVKPAPKTTDVFEQALQRATSHQEPVPLTKKGRRAARALRQRMIGYGAGAMAVLAIVGFLGFTNVDTIKYRVASNSAGFSASIPAYEPKGFNLSSVQSRSGYIGARYTGSIDGVNRSFAITQKVSDWNSDALRTSIAASGDNVNVNTYEKGGRTIYVYGSNQAAWVSGGVLYQVLGNGVLDNNDFVAIATSI